MLSLLLKNKTGGEKMKITKNIFGIIGCFLALMIGSSIGLTTFNNINKV